MGRSRVGKWAVARSRRPDRARDRGPRRSCHRPAASPTPPTPVRHASRLARWGAISRRAATRVPPRMRIRWRGCPPPPPPRVARPSCACSRATSGSQPACCGVCAQRAMSSANKKLVDAAESGDVPEIERQIAAGADPNALLWGWTPLQRCVQHGHIAAIAALVRAGAHVDGANSYGETPVIMAAYTGCASVIEALVAAGADVHRVRIDGHTALHFASMGGHPDAARALLEAGANANVPNKAGMPPIDVVRCAARSLVAAAHSRHAAAPPLRHAQVCLWTNSKSNEAALREVLTAAAPWSRRRPVAVACYADVWEWEA
jgi:uncharacterized protein